MRRIILASVCLVAFGSAAHAQIAVDSVTADVNAGRELLNEAKSYLMQGQQYVTEAQSLVQLTNTFNAFVQNPSMGAAMGLMNMTGLGNSLPVNPTSLMSLTSGNSMSLSGLSSRLGALSGLANTAYNQNHVYSCTDGSWACTQQQQRGYGIAGTMGIAQASYQDIVNHQAVLQSLRSQAETAQTPAQRENLEVAIQAEVDWQQNEMSLVNSAKMQAEMDQASAVQQDNEKLSQSLQQTFDELP